MGTEPLDQPRAAVAARSVFLDPSGRRWARLRRGALALGVATTVLVAVVVAGILLPPVLPGLAALATRPRDVRLPAHLAGTRAERAHRAARRRLFAARQRRPRMPDGKPSLLAIQPTAGAGELVAFYVSWDDNSLASFRAHAALLDYVVGEWSFIVPEGDSLRVAIDERLLAIARGVPAARRPRVLLLVSNYDSAGQRFDRERLRRLLGSAMARARAVAQLRSAVHTYGLGGVTIDFEEVPDDLHPDVLRFLRELRDTLAPAGAMVTQAVPPGLSPSYLGALAAVNDRIFLMLYDEHYGKGDPGPVASQRWFERQARRALRSVPAGKLVLAIGAYGYDWNDGGPDDSGTEMTFEDVMLAGRERGATMRFDTVSLTPYVTWTDADSTDHVAWYLDAVTAYNQMQIGRALGVAGHAVWRLGSEDPTLWRLFGGNGERPTAQLSDISPGYDVKLEGDGELLRVAARPSPGRRELHVDQATKLIVGEQITQYPSPYVVQRAGAASHEVALTFDDGPDGTYTPAILDTLRKYGAPGTFFLIGQNVEAHMALARRIVREGHEVGNHTFTHPNLALTSPLVTRLELDATERVLEAALNRRSILFRPPYFGDAEPTTADELVPVGIAGDLGYLTAGLRLDSEDWRQPGVHQIVRNVLDRRRRGNVVLLHDGGGARGQTVAALGPLIDSLRARGDTLVPLSQLAGMTPAQVMPALPPGSAVTRLAELATFGVVGATEFCLYWLLVLALTLGAARLVGITGLALIQRRRARRPHVPYAPSVSVLVPAHDEAKVITRTVESLLAQRYPGALEIIVVDDGSTDGTANIARAAFEPEPRVVVRWKPNGGKASALNLGLALARGEVVVAVDADTIFRHDSIARLVSPLAEPHVGAVAGNAKVGNRINVVTKWQAVEYVTSQNIDRRAFSLLDCITVVPGAIGAWRASLVREVGGFSDDTLAEDQDLTLVLRRRGHTIAYAEGAIAFTEAPDTFRGLARQRFRWSFGTLQCMWKHRDVLFRSRYGTLGWVAMPNVWLFQLLFTALSPVADLMFLWSLFSIWLAKAQHGATYALLRLEHVLALYALFLLVDWATAMIAFLLEPGEDRRLTWLIVLQRFAYRQIMYLVVLRSFAAAIRGGVVGWGKLERKATVELAPAESGTVGARLDARLR